MNIVQIESTSDAADALARKLRNQGSLLLGEGVFGRTYSHPTNPNLVIKLSHTVRQGWKRGSMDDDGYYRYLKGISLYPSIYQPRVSAISILQASKTDALLVVTMERLQDHNGDMALFSDTFDGADYWSFNAKFAKRLASKPDRNLSNLGRSLAYTFETAKPDMHRGNWLVRENGLGVRIPVIIDPAA